MSRKILILFLFIPAVVLGVEATLPDSHLVLQKSDSPLISFRILFQTGSAADPSGKEGLAALTASLLSDGSTQKNDYRKILQLLFPMAASYGSQVDKEMTVIAGVVHRDHLMAYYGLLRDAILSPAFKPEDFERLKTDQLNYVAKTLRYNNDEELGKEVLNQMLFRNHPYGHPNAGTVSGNQAITLQDVKNFYQREYTRKNVIFGIAGNFSDVLIAEIRKDFGSLPEGSKEESKIPEAPTLEGLHVVLIEKKTPATAISFGLPISFTRADDDFYPMMVMNSWFGQHRNQFSHLYQVMRKARGMNYGDYSYIEHFANGGRNFQPPPNHARSRQIFQVWIRPVPNKIRHFAVRQAVREMQLLIQNGLSEEDFQATKNFLSNYNVSLAQSNSEQLGYALDDVFYGLDEPFLKKAKGKLNTLTREDIHRAIRNHLQTKNMAIVVVTEDAAALKKAFVENTSSPIEYDSPKADSILEEDKVIQEYAVNIPEKNIQIIPVEKIFE